MTRENAPLYSVVVPVYRSERSLSVLCKEVLQVFADLSLPVEMILVDDCSPDASWKVMKELHAGDERIRIVRLARNFGQHNALMCGFAHVRGDYILTMDDDLQHPPTEIPKLIEAMNEQEDCDVVIGAYISKQHNWIRRQGTRAMHWFSATVLETDKKLQLTSFRLIRRYIIDEMTRISMEKPRIGRLLVELSGHIINVPVVHEERKYGRSGYSFFRLVKDFFTNIISTSAVPLKLVSMLGFCSATLSFFLGIYYLYRFFFVGISVPGWTTLIVVSLFHFGVLLFSMGVVGEYLIRILKEGKKMPQYIIRDKEL